MERTIENCFYCQNLGGISVKLGLCSFCGKKSRPVMVPLYEVYQQGKVKQFCCCCAWWRLPHSETEKVAENKWHQQSKKGQENELIKKYQQRVRKFLFNCLNCEDMGYTVIRCGDEIVGTIDCDCSKYQKNYATN